MNRPAKTLHAALIGHPVAHSLSPLIHEYWRDLYGLGGGYTLVDVAGAEGLEAAVLSLRDDGCQGFNVTIPYKRDMLALCNNLDDAARETGAVNLVAIGADGTLSGKNTDAYGFIASLKEECPQFVFDGSSALVLGAGGAARAVCYGLKQAGVETLYVANRTHEKAALLAARYDGQALTWAEKDSDRAAQCDLVVNTTSLGLSGNAALAYDFSGLKSDAVICDIVYRPAMTAFLQGAQDKGLATVGGIGMLLHQARPSFKAWTGIMPEVTAALRQKIQEAL